MKKKMVILGSTGSVGRQTLDICRDRGDTIVALAAHSNVERLAEQAREFGVKHVAIADSTKLAALKLALADMEVQITAGAAAVADLAALPGVDIVLNAVVGIAGLRPTLMALQSGNALALANKEALITGGSLVMDTARRCGTPLLPVDSEHSAIWQCLQAGEREDVRGIVLTASGGPFFGRTRDEMKDVTRAQALAHPNWSMGPKITVDCATLMNKGLEFIEAMWLFDLTPDQIEVVVHRQSIIHSAVEYLDGSVIAQLSVPDMHLAIQYALTYPRHLPLWQGKHLSLTDCATLTFAKPDAETFQCLQVCIDAAKASGLAPTIANGANEAAVAYFLEDKISFLQIGELVQGAAAALRAPEAVTLENIELADQMAREYVHAKVNETR